MSRTNPVYRVKWGVRFIAAFNDVGTPKARLRLALQEKFELAATQTYEEVRLILTTPGVSDDGTGTLFYDGPPLAPIPSDPRITFAPQRISSDSA